MKTGRRAIQVRLKQCCRDVFWSIVIEITIQNGTVRGGMAAVTRCAKKRRGWSTRRRQLAQGVRPHSTGTVKEEPGLLDLAEAKCSHAECMPFRAAVVPHFALTTSGRAGGFFCGLIFAADKSPAYLVACGSASPAELISSRIEFERRREPVPGGSGVLTKAITRVTLLV